jgi:hypothetical protein
LQVAADKRMTHDAAHSSGEITQDRVRFREGRP